MDHLFGLLRRGRIKWEDLPLDIQNRVWEGLRSRDDSAKSTPSGAVGNSSNMVTPPVQQVAGPTPERYRPAQDAASFYRNGAPRREPPSRPPAKPKEQPPVKKAHEYKAVSVQKTPSTTDLMMQPGSAGSWAPTADEQAALFEQVQKANARSHQRSNPFAEEVFGRTPDYQGSDLFGTAADVVRTLAQAYRQGAHQVLGSDPAEFAGNWGKGLAPPRKAVSAPLSQQQRGTPHPAAQPSPVTKQHQYTQTETATNEFLRDVASGKVWREVAPSFEGVKVRAPKKGEGPLNPSRVLLKFTPPPNAMTPAQEAAYYEAQRNKQLRAQTAEEVFGPQR